MLFTNEKDREQCFESLTECVTSKFYHEKHIQMYEEQFDLEKYDHLMQLQMLLMDQMKQTISEEDRRSDALNQINRILVQRLAMQRLVQIAHMDQLIYEKCWQLIKRELDHQKTKCNLKGDVYVERTNEILSL